MYLGLDLGTTNVKALLVDDGGALQASLRFGYADHSGTESERRVGESGDGHRE